MPIPPTLLTDWLTDLLVISWGFFPPKSITNNSYFCNIAYFLIKLFINVENSSKTLPSFLEFLSFQKLKFNKRYISRNISQEDIKNPFRLWVIYILVLDFKKMLRFCSPNSNILCERDFCWTTLFSHMVQGWFPGYNRNHPCDWWSNSISGLASLSNYDYWSGLLWLVL